MTSQLARLYALVTGVLVFFLVWTAVAAHPWAPQAARDPRLGVLAARQQRVQLESLRVKQIVDRRWATYRRALATRNALSARVAATPSVRVVNLPPLVVTRTS